MSGVNVVNATYMAKQRGIEIVYSSATEEDARTGVKHPNSIKVEVRFGSSRVCVWMCGVSDETNAKVTHLCNGVSCSVSLMTAQQLAGSPSWQAQWTRLVFRVFCSSMSSSCSWRCPSLSTLSCAK